MIYAPNIIKIIARIIVKAILFSFIFSQFFKGVIQAVTFNKIPKVTANANASIIYIVKETLPNIG